MYIKKDGEEISLEVNEEGIVKDSEGTSYYITGNNHISPALAVFAGNIFKKLLGDYQPDYYFTSDNERACNLLDDFAHFQLSQSSPLSVEYKGSDYPFDRIKNFSAIIIAGYYLGEIDWDFTNIGLVPAQGNDANRYDLVAVRVDPGHSFQFRRVVAFNIEHFEEVLNDPFRMVIGGINYQAFRDGHTEGINEYYFSDLFEDLSATSDELESSDESAQWDSFTTTGALAPLNYLGYKIPELKELLNNDDEIKELMKKILYLPDELLIELAKKSGVGQKEMAPIISVLSHRRSRFEDILKDNYSYSFSMQDWDIYFPEGKTSDERGNEPATLSSISPFTPMIEFSTSNVEPMELDEVSAAPGAFQLLNAGDSGENEHPQPPLVKQLISTERMKEKHVNLEEVPSRPKRARNEKESEEELAEEGPAVKKRKPQSLGFFVKAPESDEDSAQNDMVPDTSYKNP